MSIEGDRAEPGRLDLTALDRIKAGLTERFPGWKIWYVPHATDRHVTWCAQPGPLINADSPERLAFDICAAHAAVPHLRPLP
jgi:hypothetical protein